MSSEFRPQPQSASRYREVSIGHAPVQVTEEQGVLHMRSLEPLAELPARLLDRLVHWARVRPADVYRRTPGRWRLAPRELQGDARQRALDCPRPLSYGLSADKPLALLSGNDIEHLQVALGAMYAGIPYCPVSPAYSAAVPAFRQAARHVCGLLQPGLVFVSDAAAYQRAIEAVLPAETPLISVRGEVPGRTRVSFDSLLKRRVAPRLKRRLTPRARTALPSSSSLRARPNCPRP